MDQAEPASNDAIRDEWLVLRCQLGERAAFDDLIARWHPALARYVLGVTRDRDTSADLVQDVWLRVLRGLPRLRDATRFRAWLFGIARNVVVDRLRLRYATPQFDDVDLVDLPADEASGDRADDFAQLDAELDALPLVEREVLVLFYLRELGLQEIAEITAVPVGTVKSRLFRARRMLRHRLLDKEIS